MNARMSLPSRIASCLLGAFICIELVYIPLSNALQRVPLRKPPLPDELLVRYQREGQFTSAEPVQSAIDSVGIGCDRWGELTAQYEGWSLFAPRFGTAGTFLALQVTAEDGSTTELRSRFEPADVNDYFRYDLTHYKLFCREIWYSLIYWTWEEDSFDTHGPEWRDVIREYSITFRRSLSGYIRWRLSEEYSGPPVREVTLAVRVFLPPKSGGTSPRPAPVTVPMMRWVPQQPDRVAPYDPVTGRFAE